VRNDFKLLASDYTKPGHKNPVKISRLIREKGQTWQQERRKGLNPALFLYLLQTGIFLSVPAEGFQSRSRSVWQDTDG
jgi:hypothetical protein